MLKKAVRLSVVAALIITLFAAFSSLSAAVFLSNAPFPDDGGPCVGSPYATAVAFKTGGADTSIGSVTVLWHEVSTGANINLELYSDNAGNPGSSVASFGTVTTSDGGFVTHTYTPGSPIIVKANTTYWLHASSPTGGCVAGWGQNPTVPTGIFTYVGTKQFTGSWVTRGSVSVEISEGAPPAPPAPGEEVQFEPGDGRLNHATSDRAAPVAAYCLPHGIQIRVIDPATGVGIDPPAINIFNEEIEAAGIPTEENLLLAENNGVSLYRLTTGEFQVNVLNANSLEYKWFVFVWDQCPVPNSYYHLELKG